MIDVTVPIPESRLEEFYGRFADFLAGHHPPTLDTAHPLHELGTAPAWTSQPDAEEVATTFWRDVTDAGRDILRVFVDGALTTPPRSFTPGDVLRSTHAGSTQAVAGVLGGVGKLAYLQGLPLEKSAAGSVSHFLWEWDEKRRLYSMTREVAELLRKVGA